MSINSSLNAGVLGLAANSTRLSTIADNLANSSTVGYKRSDVQFESVVNAQNGGRRAYAAGGVAPTIRHALNERGTLQNTTNSTDIAIGGRGFLPVVKTLTPGAVDQQRDEMLLTTAGSFRPDDEGYLRNAAGLYLQGWRLNSDGTMATANPARDSFQSLETVNITGGEFKGSPTTAIGFGANLPARSTEAGVVVADATVETSFTYYDPLGKAEQLTLRFAPQPPPAPAPGAAEPPASNAWTLTVVDNATAAGNGVVGTFNVRFSPNGPAAGTILPTPAVAPNPAGVEAGAGNPATTNYDPATGEVTFITGAGEPVRVRIGGPNLPGGLIQYDGDYTAQQITKDGAQFAQVAGTEIQENGVVNAVLTNGQRRPIFQIPLADVVNPEGLTPVQGTAYKLSLDSGSMYLWNAGDGPVGTTLGNSLESSTTDVARELTNLIETQRAYSSNAKIIQTADEMLQETTNLKR